MGIAMGLLSKGFSQEQLTDRVYKKLVQDEKLDSYEKFHIAMLQAFNTFNAMVPGVHYDAPKQDAVKSLHEKWQGETNEEKRKELFKKFMEDCKSKPNKTAVSVGLVAPPAAMILKRTAETIPQLKKLTLVPDVLFVPGATMLALGGIKFYSMNTTVEKASQSQIK